MFDRKEYDKKRYLFFKSLKFCPTCKTKVLDNKVFCLNCRIRINKSKKYDLKNKLNSDMRRKN